MHYGYVAYQDIHLGGKRVQPEGSPYYHVLPARQLLPFTNIEVGQIDEKLRESKNRKKYQPPVKIVQKTAFECASEMETSYADWNFQLLKDLTGYAEEDADRIFQVVQPFPYKLKDIQVQLGAATDRIEATEPYTVIYEGQTADLKPLSERERAVAYKVLGQLQSAANIAVEMAVEKFQKTVTSMTRAFAGGDGKVTPDPLDRKLAVELGNKLPQLVDVKQEEVARESESVLLKREEIELRRKEIELKERELALREADATKEANREKMAAVRAAKQPTA